MVAQHSYSHTPHTRESYSPSEVAENEALELEEESYRNQGEPAGLDDTEVFRNLLSPEAWKVSLQNVEDDALGSFNQSFQDAVARAEICKGDKKKVAFTTEMQSELEQALLPAGNARTDGMVAISVPGPRADEVSCTHPYLDKLLRCLGICVEVDSQQQVSSSDEEKVHPTPKDTLLSPQVYSPPKSPLVDRLIPRVGDRTNRVVDRSVVPLRRYQFACRAPVLEGWMKHKRGERTGQKPRNRLDEGIYQICGHFVKYVALGFDFRGCGVSCFATGLVLTPAYVVVVRLELEEMGTPTAKLVVKQSHILPLFSQANFKRWYEADSNYKAEWEKIGTEMYSNDSGIVPAGLRFLWKFVRDRGEGHYDPKLAYDSCEVGDMLGSGAFATVHIAVKHRNSVCKISRVGYEKEIQNEQRILSALKQDHIPTVISSENTKINVGNHEIEVPTLTLSPRGESVVNALAMGQTYAVAMLEVFGDQIKSALDYLHGKSIFHCDVSTRNIIVADNKAYLIDFGISKKGKEEHRGFKGTIAFAHHSVFTKFPGKVWEPKAYHDVSSLGLTMAALMYITSAGVDRRRGRIPWDKPRTIRLTEEEIQEYHGQRLKCVEDIVQDKEHKWYKWAGARLPFEEIQGS